MSYAIYRFEARHGIPLESLPEDPTDRPVWIGLIGQRLRAGKYQPVGRLTLDPSADHDALPASPGYLYVNDETGAVLACPGGQIQEIGDLLALLGYPSVAHITAQTTVAFEIAPDGPGAGIRDDAVVKTRRRTLPDTPQIDHVQARSVARAVATLTEALDQMSHWGDTPETRIGLHQIYPAGVLYPRRPDGTV